MSYLDENGLTRVWGKIKSFVTGEKSEVLNLANDYTDSKINSKTANEMISLLGSGTSNDYFDYAFLTRAGKVKILRCSGKTKQAMGAGTQYIIGTVTDEDFKPLHYITGNVVVAHTGIFGTVTCNTNGNIVLTPRKEISSGTTCYFEFVYI